MQEISYSDYLSEEMDKNIKYAEYIAENIEKSANYSEYIAEQMDKNIQYTEYLAGEYDTIETPEKIAKKKRDLRGKKLKRIFKDGL